MSGRRSAWRRRRAEPGFASERRGRAHRFSWSSVMPSTSLELGDRLGGVADLDRRHAHRPGRLEVDAEVVEEHALGRARRRAARTPSRRTPAPACARRSCSTRRRRRSGPSRRRRRRRSSASSGAATLFVRHAVCQPGSSDTVERDRPSPRAPRPASRASTSAPGTSWPSAADSAAKAASKPAWSSSARSSRAQALASGSVALTERMKSVGRPCSRLVVAERLERAGQDHAAEVPQYRSDHGRYGDRSTIAAGRIDATHSDDVEPHERGGRRRLQHRDRGPLHAEPGAAQRRGDGVPRGVPRRRRHRRRRRHVRAPHRQEGGEGVRRRPSPTTSSSPRRPAPSAAATPSC